MKQGKEKQAECVDCLSMHQPWASMLVYGIKRIEGRNWPTKHRGWLWIASTAQEPSAASIEVRASSCMGACSNCALALQVCSVCLLHK